MHHMPHWHIMVSTSTHHDAPISLAAVPLCSDTAETPAVSWWLPPHSIYSIEYLTSTSAKTKTTPRTTAALTKNAAETPIPTALLPTTPSSWLLPPPPPLPSHLRDSDACMTSTPCSTITGRTTDVEITTTAKNTHNKDAFVKESDEKKMEEVEWTREENQRFLIDLDQHGSKWKQIAEMIQSRSKEQINKQDLEYFSDFWFASEDKQEVTSDTTVETTVDSVVLDTMRLHARQPMDSIKFSGCHKYDIICCTAASTSYDPVALSIPHIIPQQGLFWN